MGATLRRDVWEEPPFCGHERGNRMLGSDIKQWLLSSILWVAGVKPGSHFECQAFRQSVNMGANFEQASLLFSGDCFLTLAS